MGKVIAGLLALLVFAAAPASAQTQPPPLRVATRVLPPLVVANGGPLTGFTIDIWSAIAERLKLETRYTTLPDIDALLNAVETDAADVGVGAISITAARDARFDFSQPIYDSGLQIMVRAGPGVGAPNPLVMLLRLLFSKAILVWLGIALLLILVPAHLVWLVERNHKAGIIPDPRYIPGIFHAMYWAAGTLATQAEQMPRHWIGRLLAIFWMFVGVVFVAFYTAQLTATLTVQQFHSAISGPGDFPGKQIATIRGSTASAYLREVGAQVQDYDSLDDAAVALADEKADAVVFDAPVLLYYTEHRGKGRVRVVGNIFRNEEYGILLKPGSPLRRRVDAAFLALREDGTYDALYRKWFGAP
jgi:polar amino acid transport system substrate-binding protein